MDRITRKLFEDFCNEYEINDTEAKAFEKFCNHTVVSNAHNKTFDVDVISTGDANDIGIDGVAVLINGHLVEDAAEVEAYIDEHEVWDVAFLFIQSKTSSSFKSKDIRTFFSGVEDFFNYNEELPINSQIESAMEISEAIFEHVADFKDNPSLKLYYITTGQYNPDDRNIKNTCDKAQRLFEQMNLFSTVEIQLIGASQLCALYRKTKAHLTASFVFISKVTLPDIKGIDQSYSGMLPFEEFRKLLLDDNNNPKNVFDDNVRDFIGTKNSVNKGIADTLKSNNPHLFSVLNNGVTVVANSIKTSANNFTITDYQIVNGCQTSNVLYECRGLELDNLYIPFRLIVTDDDDIKAQITLSTNTQTAIKKEQLTAMSSFQKNLEVYYTTISGEGQLYYERRTKQYATNSNIKKKRIVTVANQIKSFSSMHYADPHLVTTYFGKTVDKTRSNDPAIFNDEHSFSPYYLAGLAYFRLDCLLSKGIIDPKFKKVRFYLLMLVPYIVTGDKLPDPKKKNKTEASCDNIISKLNSTTACQSIFKEAVNIIEKSGAKIEDKESLKSKKMTDEILNEFQNRKTQKKLKKVS